LVRGATYLRSEGSDDSTDAVVSLVTTISTFSTSRSPSIKLWTIHGTDCSFHSSEFLVLNQGVDDKSYDSKKKHYDLLTKALRVFPRQKVLPRKIWVARAELYSCSSLCVWSLHWSSHKLTIFSSFQVRDPVLLDGRASVPVSMTSSSSGCSALRCRLMSEVRPSLLLRSGSS
jgi:hypothetical protein